jgi:glucose/arabinose dehydrogenase
MWPCTHRGIAPILLFIVLVAMLAPACRDDAAPSGAGSSTGSPAGSDTAATVAGGSETSDAGSSTTGSAPSGPLRLSFRALEVEGDLAMVTELRFLPGADELLATSKDGRVGHFRLEGDRLLSLGGFAVPGVHSDLDCGLVSLALSPDWARDRLVYVGMCTSQTESGVYRFRWAPGDGDDEVAATLHPVITAGDPTARKPWHNVGSVGFDSTGALWALFGDKRVAEHGQLVSDDLSALVRVLPDPDPDGEATLPAPDNPFVRDPAASPNVYAYGLRSPWRGTLDAQGRWWIGDVGAGGAEEIDLVTAPGDNFGWPLAEGPCDGECDGLVQPVVSWPHDTTTEYMNDDEDVRATVARVAWVGLQYPAAADTDPYAGRLDGAVLFGDFCLGFVRALEVDDDGVVQRDEHLGHLAMPSSWAVGPGGFVYAATFGRCETAGLDEADPPPSGFYRAVPAEE